MDQGDVGVLGELLRGCGKEFVVQLDRYHLIRVRYEKAVVSPL